MYLVLVREMKRLRLVFRVYDVCIPVLLLRVFYYWYGSVLTVDRPVVARYCCIGGLLESIFVGHAPSPVRSLGRSVDPADAHAVALVNTNTIAAVLQQ